MNVQAPYQKQTAYPGWLYQSLDAALTAPLNSGSAGALLRAALRPRTSNFQRVRSLVGLGHRLTPGLAKRMAARLWNLRYFALAGFDVRLLAYGLGGTVFLLERPGDRRVLKVYRRTLGRPARAALKVAAEFHAKHRELSARFNHPDEIVIPSAYFLLHSPLLGAASAAVLQPFVAGTVRDLFVDLTDEDVLALARRDSAFGRQLVEFSRRLFAMIEETQTCFDLVGKENLMLVETPQGTRLKIADIGIIDLRLLGQRSAALQERLPAYLNRLRSLAEQIERRPAQYE